MKILHLEDSAVDAELIDAEIRTAWPDAQISIITNKAAYESAVLAGDFDLILSDYTLPGYDGISALQFARVHVPDRPFIYLSGTIGEERAIEALKAGATDYVIKDRPARLIPAIRAALDQVALDRARQQAEEKIREQAALLDKAREAIAVTDPNGFITYWNASAERLYGWKPEEAQGRNLGDILYSSDSYGFESAFALVTSTGEWRGELRPVSRSGEPIVVESSWSLVLDADGKPKSILIIDADVTERKRIHEQLMRAQRLESLALLAGGIAHDLNNVLGPILTSVDLLRMNRSQDQDILTALEDSAQHGADLVRQLLGFVRGTGEERRELSVAKLLESVRRMVQPALPSAIHIQLDEMPQEWEIHGDATQLRQVLLNLCLNARDALPDGGRITISAEYTEVDPGSVPLRQGDVQEGPYIRIAVADNGTGIPPEILDRIFEPFFTTKSDRGTGLGLHNVVTIVKSHDGFLTIDSEPGRGTTFHVYLPTRSANVPGVQRAKQGILVIDDDDAIRTVLEVILTGRGYYVALAGDANAAQEILERDPERFHLILSDFNLAATNVLPVIRKVRQMPVPPKIVVMSGLPLESYDEAGELKDVSFLPKPITLDRLLQAIRRELAAH